MLCLLESLSAYDLGGRLAWHDHIRGMPVRLWTPAALLGRLSTVLYVKGQGGAWPHAGVQFWGAH